MKYINLFSVIYFVTVCLGKSDAANITKVIFAQEVFNGSGLLYLPGESVDAVYPRGAYF